MSSILILTLFVILCSATFLKAFRLLPTAQIRLSHSMAKSDTINKAVVTIGTRGSPLALAQAYETKRLLGLHFPELAIEGAVKIQKIMTKVC